MARRPHHGSEDEELGEPQEEKREHGREAGRLRAGPNPTPIVGSLVHYHSIGNDRPDPGEEPLCAIVASVLSENGLNLMVIGADGAPFGKQSVLFCRKGDSPMGLEYCDVPGAEAASEDEQPKHSRREKAKELLQQAQALSERIAARKQEIADAEKKQEAEREAARQVLKEPAQPKARSAAKGEEDC